MAFVRARKRCPAQEDDCGLAEYSKQSEQKSAFAFKTTTNDENYVKAPAASSMQYARQIFERGNQMMPSRMNVETVYQADFSPKKLKLEHPMRNAWDAYEIENPYCAVEKRATAHQPGYHKYLDIYARLDYPLHSAEEPTTELRNGDQITLWNWLLPKSKKSTFNVKVPPQKCDDAEQDAVVQAHAINPFVPHRGLLSEHQEFF